MSTKTTLSLSAMCDRVLVEAHLPKSSVANIASYLILYGGARMDRGQLGRDR